MLSAVSQQVQTIQEALKSQKEAKKEGSLVIELVGKQVTNCSLVCVVAKPMAPVLTRCSLVERALRRCASRRTWPSSSR